jgi:hypothetical protein
LGQLNYLFPVSSFKYIWQFKIWELQACQIPVLALNWWWFLVRSDWGEWVLRVFKYVKFIVECVTALWHSELLFLKPGCAWSWENSLAIQFRLTSFWACFHAMQASKPGVWTTWKIKLVWIVHFSIPSTYFASRFLISPKGQKDLELQRHRSGKNESSICYQIFLQDLLKINCWSMFSILPL